MSDTSPDSMPDFESAVDSALAADAAPSPDPSSPEPSEGTDTPETPTEAPASPVAALADDTPIEVIVDGKPVTLPYGEAKKGFMMHAAFTKKTQEVAAQRKEAERMRVESEQWRQTAQQQVQAAERFRADVLQMLQNPTTLSALYLKATEGHGATPLAADTPGMGASPAMVDPSQLRQQLLQELVPEVQQNVTAYLAQQQQEVALVNDVTTFTESLIADNPVLSAFGPDLTNVIYEKVAGMEPQNAEEAKTFIRLQVDAYKDKLKSITGAQAKAAAVVKAQAAAGIQRGGSPVVPAKKDYTSFNDMQSDMEAFLGA